MSGVVERARVWLRVVHRGSAAEIIPDLLDEVDRLQQDCTIQRARAEKAEAERDRLAATVERARALVGTLNDDLDAAALSEALGGEGDTDD